MLSTNFLQINCKSLSSLKLGGFFISFSLLTIFLMSSCQSSSLLDKTFNLASYNKIISTKLYNSDEITESDWFIMNYAIKRQKDVFGYEIEGKTYREILEMAKEMDQNGLPVKTTFNFNGQQDGLICKVENQGPGMIRSGKNRKILKKMLNFSCTYENTSDRTIVVENSTFQIIGPFGDHITSLGYVFYCPIKPKQRLVVEYLVNAKEVLNNLRFRENYYVEALATDVFLHSIDIRAAGNSIIKKNASSFTPCKHSGARIEPLKIFDYFKDVDVEKCIIKDASGTIVEFHLGDAHYEINDQQEIQNMSRIGQGKK